MTDIFLNPNMIANLNIFQHIPSQILKLIIDRIVKSISQSIDSMNEDQIQIILRNEQVQCKQWKKGINTLKYFLKHCRRHQVPVKVIVSFFSENTLVPSEFTQYLGEKYAVQQLQKKQNPKIAIVSDTNWALFNLKQNQSNQTINKIYFKNQITTYENGHSKNIVFVTQLPQFKYLKSEIQLIGSKIQ